MSLRDFFRILWLEKWIIVITLIVVVGGAAYYQHRSVPSYASSTTIALNPVLRPSGSTSTASLWTVQVSDVSQSSVLEPAAAELGMSTGQLAASLAILSPEDNVVSIVASAESPSAAQAVASTVADETVTVASKGFTTYLGQLQSSLDKLTSVIDDLQKRYNATIQNGVGDVLLQSQLNLAVQQYQTLFTQVSTAQAVSNPVIITNAADPGVLTSTSTRTLLALAFFAGLVAGIGLGLLRFWLDGRVIGSWDVRAATDVPVLGTVPRGPRKKGSDRLPAGRGSDGDPSVEAFRALRAAVFTLLRQANGRTVLVTGVDLGVGASYVAVNLAASAARAGSTTIVADGDVRRPSLDGYLSVGDDTMTASQEQASEDGAASASASAESTARSLRSHRVQDSEFVANARPVQNKPMTTSVDNLSVVPSLIAADEGTDALAGQGVFNLIEELRDGSDFVVVDAPPVLAVADPIALGGFVDAVLLIVQSGRTRTRSLVRALHRLHAADITTVGVVVNRVRRGRTPRGVAARGSRRRLLGSSR